MENCAKQFVVTSAQCATQLKKCAPWATGITVDDSQVVLSFGIKSVPALKTTIPHGKTKNLWFAYEAIEENKKQKKEKIMRG